VHTVLEHVDFAAPEPELRQTIETWFAGQGFAASQQDQLARGLAEALRTGLGAGFCLADVPRSARLHEMEFVLPVTNALTPNSLERVFREQRAPRALPGYTADLKELGFERLTGFLRGFVDLIFVHEGRFYLVDYKSNWLGPKAEDYQGEGLLRAMAEHHYFLQYHLYCVALQRYLALRVRDYAYERHFGGVYYLFLRGMSPAHAPGTGVFFDQPPSELLAALERCLGESGIATGSAAP
jgi:exodeoxyribonuclease V beta subunit